MTVPARLEFDANGIDVDEAAGEVVSLAYVDALEMTLR
jgi:hypothetical protein